MADENQQSKKIIPHPIFKATKGGIESWEKITVSAK